MKPTRLILLALSLFGLAACAIFQNPPHCVDRGDGICWFVNPVQIPVTKVRWEVDTSVNASKRCGYGQHYHNAACVMGRLKETGECWIVSARTEEQAKRIPTGDRYKNTTRWKSIYRHEVEDHCGIMPNGTTAVQWSHSDTSIWMLTGDF